MLNSLRILLLLFCWCTWAQAEQAIPTLHQRVTDLTGTLNQQQRQTLEQQLQQLEAEKGAQLAILIVPSTKPETIEQYSMRVVEQWELGRAKTDDGVLLLVAKEDRTMRIEVGYGLEGALTDATSKRIIAEVITPYFKQGDFYGGLSQGVNSLIQVINGEALPEVTHNPNQAKEDKYGILFFAVIVSSFIGSILRILFGRFPASLLVGIGVGLFGLFIGLSLLTAFLGAFFAFIFTYANTRGGSGSYSSGGGGDGFSGGGGGFGGGGASGRW